MFGYIYKTTNIINGKIYIGQKKSSKFLGNKYLGSGKVLLQSVDKNGKENFNVELIEECTSSEELNEREIYWISFYHSTDPDIGYNLSDGGFVPRLSGIHNGFYGKHHSEETREKFKQRKKRYGQDSSMFGKHHSEETKKLISEKNKGRKQSDEAKQKRLDSIAENGGYGWWITDEYKKKLSDSSKGKNTWAKGSIWINNGSETKMIAPSEFDKYSSQGWVRGRLKMSDAQKQKIGASCKGKTAFNKGSIIVTKNGCEKFIPEQDLQSYLNDGWHLGRAPVSNETKQKMSIAAKGKKRPSLIWITNGVDNKRIMPDLLEEYLLCGWVKGHTNFRKHKM